MRVLLKGETMPEHEFGGTTPLGAELRDETIEMYKMRPALERFGRALAEQFREFGNARGRKVIGVELTEVQFSLVTAKREPSDGRA